MAEQRISAIGEPGYTSSDSSESTLCAGTSIQSADKFLDEHGSIIHPAFDCGRPIEQEPLQRLQPAVFGFLVRHHAEQFLEAMETHQSTLKDRNTNPIDLRAKHSWNDMIKAADNAQKAYENAGFSTWRKAGRGLSAHAAMAQPFLRLIPNDFFASILYGGLRLVFEAFSQIDQKRSEVLKALLRIPSIIALAEDCVKNFPSDDLLYQRAENLFCSALPAIEETTRWLKQNPAAKQIRALFLGPLYNKTFKEKLQTLDEALTALQERVSVLRDGSIRKIEEVVDNVKDRLKRTGTLISTVSDDIRQISRSQNETRAKIDDLHDFEQIKEQAREAMRIVLEQKIQTAEWMKKKDRVIGRLKRQIEAIEQVTVSLTEDDLLEILDVVAGLASLDLRQACKACRDVELEEIEIAQSIIQADRLTQWVSADAPTALLIEGEYSGSSGRNTPLSFLCVEMIRMFQDKGPAVPIHFFCGMHTSPNDALRGPCGVMRSLISQVIRVFPPKLDFISRRYRQNLEALQLHTLCDCFCRLVRKLPIDTVVVCIIDGVSNLETREWATSCRELITHLQGLLDEDDGTPVFKLLLASPTRSRYIGSALGDDCRIVLPSKESTNARHGPTDRELAMTGTRPKTSFATGARGSLASRKRKRHRFSMSLRQTETTWSDTDSESSRDRDKPPFGADADAEMDVDTDEAGEL